MRTANIVSWIALTSAAAAAACDDSGARDGDTVSAGGVKLTVESATTRPEIARQLPAAGNRFVGKSSPCPVVT